MNKRTRWSRRQFLRAAGTAGLAVSAVAPARPAMAGNTHPGPFWVTIQATGGWDPTLLCDPKGSSTNPDIESVNRYDRGDIQTVGAFSFAPVAGHNDFFTRFRDELVVFNGIDMGTNSHDTGQRHTWSGTMEADMPSFAAAVAGTAPSPPPMAFLTNGGYDRAADLIPLTRVSNVDIINELAHPARLTATDPASEVLPRSVQDRIAMARLERLERQSRATELPRHQRAVSTLYATRSAGSELDQLTEFLPGTLDESSNPLLRQAQVACASFRAGLSVSANLVVGGFDTHGNHDDSHTPRMQMVLEGVAFLMDEAERQGIADQVFVIVGSDFARTPWYNSDNGKDHWTVTSMMAMGPGITGGRVIGMTGETQEPIAMDPLSLQANPQGVILTPGSIHAALRRKAGIEAHPSLARYDVEDLLDLTL
jgi:hypothetical protein